MLLTGLYPIWFAQSSLAHADIFAAACSLWGLVYALPVRGRNPLGRRNLVFRGRAFKETAIAIPLTLAAINMVEGIRAECSGAPPAVARSCVV